MNNATEAMLAAVYLYKGADSMDSFYRAVTESRDDRSQEDRKYDLIRELVEHVAVLEPVRAAIQKEFELEETESWHKMVMAEWGREWVSLYEQPRPGDEFLKIVLTKAVVEWLGAFDTKQTRLVVDIIDEHYRCPESNKNVDPDPDNVMATAMYMTMGALINREDLNRAADLSAEGEQGVIRWLRTHAHALERVNAELAGVLEYPGCWMFEVVEPWGEWLVSLKRLDSPKELYIREYLVEFLMLCLKDNSGEWHALLTRIVNENYW